MNQNRQHIDESTRRQLLDNYLRNQQTQSQTTTTTIATAPSQSAVYHPSQFQQPLAYDGDRSETFSDMSRRSVMTTTSQAQFTHAQSQALTSVSQPQVSSNLVNIVQLNDGQSEVERDTSIVPVTDLPENISIEDFSNLVKKWIELDNWIKKSQEIAKQKRKQKDKLSEVITHYMTRYNIEDLNTSEGKIRCKVRYVKSGVNQKVVKEKITEIFKDNEETGNALITKIFNEREKIEKISLRRIKIT